MRISLGNLILIFPAYCLAVFIATVFDARAVSYAFVGEMAAADRIQNVIVSDDKYHPGEEIPVDIINQWLALEQPSNHPIVDRLVMAMPDVDSWGNPYRCVRNVESPDGERSSVGVYSMGMDGVSRTNGNDPDDINTWNVELCSKYYSGLIVQENRQTYAIHGAVTTPLTYLVLLTILKVRRWVWPPPYWEPTKFATPGKGR